MSAEPRAPSLPELMKVLADDVQELVRAEVGLAKDELKEAVGVLLLAIALATAATIVAALVVCSLVTAATLALGASTPVALAASALAGIVLVLIGVLVGARSLQARQRKPDSSRRRELDALPTAGEALR